MVPNALTGKVAIVTGGGRGVGRSVVGALLNLGAEVASLDLVQDSTALESSLLPIQCDICDEEQVKGALDQILGKWGRVDILVNNAGITDDNKGVADTTMEIWKRVLAINLHAPMFLLHSVIPQMLKNEGPHKGSIVNVLSVAAARGAIAGAAYTTSKHALLGLSRNTAWMYKDAGIRCNAVLPGGVRTGIVQNSGNLVDMGNLGALGPFLACCPGVCEPEHVANAIVFLATAESVNGAEVAVDKGWLGA